MAQSKTDELFEMLRARGLRTRVARTVSDAVGAGRSGAATSQKAAEGVIADLRKLADELEDRIRGGSSTKRTAGAKKAAATRKRNASKRSASAKKAAATRKRTSKSSSASTGTRVRTAAKRATPKRSTAKSTTKRATTRRSPAKKKS